MALFTLRQYIEHKGGAQLARELGIDEQTVYFWKAMKTAPRPLIAHTLILTTNGLLTWEGIYQPYVDFNIDKQLKFEIED